MSGRMTFEQCRQRYAFWAVGDRMQKILDTRPTGR
jgi:hypothetical protein